MRKKPFEKAGRPRAPIAEVFNFRGTKYGYHLDNISEPSFEPITVRLQITGIGTESVNLGNFSLRENEFLYAFPGREPKQEALRGNVSVLTSKSRGIDSVPDPDRYVEKGVPNEWKIYADRMYDDVVYPSDSTGRVSFEPGGDEMALMSQEPMIVYAPVLVWGGPEEFGDGLRIQLTNNTTEYQTIQSRLESRSDTSQDDDLYGHIAVMSFAFFVISLVLYSSPVPAISNVALILLHPYEGVDLTGG